MTVKGDAGPGSLRVLFLNPIGGKGWGGPETWMRQVGVGLQARGHAVAAAGRPGSLWRDVCRKEGWPTKALAMSGDFGPRGLLVLRRLYASLDINLVIVKTRRCIRMAWAAGTWRRGGRPAILCRVGDAALQRSLGSLLTYRYLADRYVTPSEDCCRRLLAHGYFGPDRIRTIRAGVRLLEEDPGARRRVRAELGLGGHQTVITTSRLHPVKGMRHAIAAVALLRQSHPRVRLLVVGAGRERRSLEEQAHALGLGASVRFLGHRCDVADVLRAADVFVLPSLDEGLPNGLLEAMAAGLPVVSSAVGGVPEAVADGATGLLVPPGEPAPLCEAVRRVLADPGLAARLARAGRDHVRAHYGLERMLAETEAYCLETRDARGRRPPRERGRRPGQTGASPWRRG